MDSDQDCAASDNPQLAGDPVDTLTGGVVDRILDFRLVGPIDFRWHRHYDSSQANLSFSVGRGSVHDFDCSLQIEATAVRFSQGFLRNVKFPILVNDGERCVADGMTLVRVTSSCYRILRHAQPAMEFHFARGAHRARLTRLVRGSHAIQFFYDLRQRMIGIEDSAGRRLLVDEDEHGLVRKVELEQTPIQSSRLLVGYRYDANGNLAETTNSQGNGYKFEYDQANRMVQRRGRRGFCFRYQYDELGRCRFAEGDGNLFGIELDYVIPGRVTKVKRKDGGVWKYKFSSKGQLEQIVDPLGGVSKFVHDGTGKIAVESDANDNLSKYEYDAAGEPIAKICPLGFRCNLPLDINAPDRRPHRVAVSAIEYEFGRLFDAVQLSLPVEGTREFETASSWWLRTQIATASVDLQAVDASQPYPVPPLRANWWPAPSQGRIFNDAGQLTSQTDQEGRTRWWKYDESGNVVEFTDFDGRKWCREYGKWHLVGSLISPDGGRCRFRYNEFEKITSAIDAGNTVSEYRYDERDLLIEVRRGGHVRESYQRDLAGNLVRKLGADGRELLRLDICPGNLVSSKQLGCGDEHEFKYDKQGHCVSASTMRHSVQMAYDGFGNRALDLRNGLGIKVRHQAAIRPSQINYLDKFIFLYAWHGNDLTIVDPRGKRHAISVLSNGIVEKRFHNGSREISQFDHQGRCRLKHSEHGGNRRWIRRFSWSGEGLLRAVEDNEKGVVRFEYDAGARLRERHVQGRVDEYEFDSAANLVKQPGLDDVDLQSANRIRNANGAVYKYNDRDHVESRVGADGATTYHYDSRDQLVRVEKPEGVWEAEYDAMGRRVRRTWNGHATEYYWYRDQLLAEIDGSGKLRLYVYADLLALTPIMVFDFVSLDSDASDCKCYYVFSDQIGTPCYLEDDEQQLAWKAEISPFGTAVVSRDAQIDFLLRFPGHYYDEALGLHYNRFRYYDPVLGRYLQSDPWGIAGGMNLYAYRDNPLGTVDVRGLGEGNDENCHQPGEDGPDAESSVPPTHADGNGDPPGTTRDANGRLRDANGQFASDPNIPSDGRHCRDTEYPSGFRQSTHDEMAARHTDEGIAQGGPPVDDNGNRIPRDQLTWRDENGNHIPFHDENGNTNLTYDHDKPVVEHWNEGGNNMSREERADAFNDPDNLTPMSRSDNSSKGGNGQTYDQNTGPDYSN